MSALLLSTGQNPGTASWESGAGPILGHDVIGFAGSGGTLSPTQSISCWCVTDNVNPVNVTVSTAPTFAGQMLSFFFTVDNGQNVVVTFPAPIDSAGNTTVTLNDASDSFVVMGVATAVWGGFVIYRWILMSNNGCVLS